MPLYEYKCEQCGEVFEVMQKFADEPISTHEKCGGHTHRLLSAPAFQFKGSGWYVTDYAKGSSGSSGQNGSEKSDKKDGAPSKTASSDTATKTPTSSVSSDTTKSNT